MPAELPLEFTREWVEFTDPSDDEHLIRADLTWLCSRWTCIFGRGCHGVISGRASDGCCNHGAYFSDKADLRRTNKWVAKLTRDEWQNYDAGHAGRRLDYTVMDEVHDEPAPKTRVVNGVCIFHNQPDFPGGHGCALHLKALSLGRNPLELKPEVCWQVPVRRSQDWIERPDGTRYLQSTVSEFNRRAWGEGGHDMDWWCTTSPDTHVGHEPLYVSYGPELTALIGEAAYAELARLCAKRLELGLVAVHPATAAAAASQRP